MRTPEGCPHQTSIDDARRMYRFARETNTEVDLAIITALGGAGPPSGGAVLTGRRHFKYLPQSAGPPPEHIFSEINPDFHSLFYNHPSEADQNTEFFNKIARNLHKSDALVPLGLPLGTYRKDWPEWAKERHPYTGKLRLPGLCEFWGDVPYEEPTPRQIITYKDFKISGEDIRLKSMSIRQAIARYFEPHLFEKWINTFINSLQQPAHYQATVDSINNIYGHFNIIYPGDTFSDAQVNEQLYAGTPNMARMHLTMSETRYRTAEHSELVLALALYQAAHAPYISHLQSAINRLDINDNQKGNVELLFKNSFSVFNSFIIYGTFLPLVILQHDKVLLDDAIAGKGRRSNLEVGTEAISKAWNVFIDKKILRRDFDELEEKGARMICPANHHLRNAKDQRTLERLYAFVHKHRDEEIIQSLCDKIERVVASATAYPHHHYERSLAEGLERNINARGGQGLTLSGLSLAA